MLRKKLPLILILIASLAAAVWWRQSLVLISFSGPTMGTAYSVKAYIPRKYTVDDLKSAVEDRLDYLTFVFSTYEEKSEISRFNRSDKGIKVSDDFIAVFNEASDIYRSTNGAWDGTVKPLVDLWGFSGASRDTVPSNRQVQISLASVGLHHIQVSGNMLVKKWPFITLDLSSIAKGYGVDYISHYLRSIGSRSFLVEIGGEVYAAGRKPNGQAWRVGVNKPSPEAGYSDIFTVIELENSALATSGDYRHYFEVDGVRYAHIIDPRTGYPVRHSVSSVSVLAPTCVLADGLATALVVMGEEDGIHTAGNMPTVEALFLRKKGEDDYSVFKTDYFPIQTNGDN